MLACLVFQLPGFDFPGLASNVILRGILDDGRSEPSAVVRPCIGLSGRNLVLRR